MIDLTNAGGWKALRRFSIRNMMKASFALLLTIGWVTGSVLAQTTIKRPHLLGIAHAGVSVSNLDNARLFYEHFLGFAEPFSLKHQDGTDWIAIIKVNDQQYLELFAGNPQSGGHLNHLALYTDDVAGMRDYLQSRGVNVNDQIHKGQIGNSFFTISDPDSHLIEIVQYAPDSQTAAGSGKFMPASRISGRISHIGILVGQLDPAMKFYKDILGFQETWRGAESGKQVSWVDMRVPDGTDYVEFMLYQDPPSLGQQKVENHISFASTDVPKTVQDLQARASDNSYTVPITVQVWANGKRETNLLDPDGARLEIMEFPATSAPQSARSIARR